MLYVARQVFFVAIHHFFVSVLIRSVSYRLDGRNVTQPGSSAKGSPAFFIFARRTTEPSVTFRSYVRPVHATLSPYSYALTSFRLVVANCLIRSLAISSISAFVAHHSCIC